MEQVQGTVHEYKPETMVQTILDERVRLELKVQSYSLGEKYDLIRSWILEIHNPVAGTRTDVQMTSKSIDEMIDYLMRVKTYWNNRPEQLHF